MYMYIQYVGLQDVDCVYTVHVHVHLDALDALPMMLGAYMYVCR